MIYHESIERNPAYICLMSFIEKYKLAYEAYNLFHKKELVHNLPLYEKYGVKKKYFSSVSSEDFRGLEGTPIHFDVANTREELPQDPFFKTLKASWQESLLNWSDQGYAILDGLLSNDQVDQINQEIETLKTNPNTKWQHGKRIMFAIHQSPLLHQTGSGDQLTSILQLLMSKKVELFQSINFFEGSQQRAHSDSIHMTTFPYGNLIAVWIALEDLSEDCGPLHYYPGSHKLPYIMNREFGNVGSKIKLGPKTYGDYEDKIESLIHEHQLKKHQFIPKKGDALIWHANLLHGGDPIQRKGATRKSMVFHYYAENAICFHEITQRPTLKK